MRSALATLPLLAAVPLFAFAPASPLLRVSVSRARPRLGAKANRSSRAEVGPGMRRPTKRSDRGAKSILGPSTLAQLARRDERKNTAAGAEMLYAGETAPETRSEEQERVARERLAASVAAYDAFDAADDAFEVGEDEVGARLDAWLSGRFPERSRKFWTAAVEGGAVALNGKVCGRKQRSHKLKEGDAVVVSVEAVDAVAAGGGGAENEAPVGEDIPLEVLYEDEHVIAINKPAGMVVHPAAGHWNGTLVNALVHRLGDAFVAEQRTAFEVSTASPSAAAAAAARPGVVHRLDKGTTGVIVVAKTVAAKQSLSASFADRLVKKRYTTLCVGCPRGHAAFGEQVTMDAPIGRHPVKRQRMAVVPPPDGRTALSEMTVIDGDGRLNVASVSIYTGRTHQIRVHLADARCPVVGDDLYGVAEWNGRAAKRFGSNRPLLHAAALELPHPATGEPLTIVAPLPDDMRRAVAAVAGDKVLEAIDGAGVDYEWSDERMPSE